MYYKSCNVASVLDAVNLLQQDADSLLMLLVCEHDTAELPQIIDALNERNIIFFGGVFANLVHNNSVHNQGIIVKKLPHTVEPFLVKGLDKANFDMPNLIPLLETIQGNLAIIYVDGLTANVATLLSALFDQLGHQVNYFGGGAGSLSLEQMPCVFNNEGLFQDAAIVAFTSLKSELSVQHGWQYLTGPLVATKTQKNVIEQINWMNAFDVYQSIVNQHTTTPITKLNFFDIAKGFPFGIYRAGEEDIVRDPISVTPEGELVCVGEVPENTILNVLRGDNEALKQAAQKATVDCFEKATNMQAIESILSMICVSRGLFMNEEFETELALVAAEIASHKDNLLLEGVLSLGEISSDGQGFLEFFNKTIVTTILSK